MTLIIEINDNWMNYYSVFIFKSKW